MNFLSQVCYVCMVPGVSQTMIQDDQYGSMICNVSTLWHLLTSFFALSVLLKSFILFFVCHFAKCTNQDNNCVYAGTILWHNGWYDTKMIPVWYGMYAMEGVDQWSLMCTSNIVGNTQMASLDRQVTQNRLGVINAIARRMYNGVVEVTVEGLSFVRHERIIVK